MSVRVYGAISKDNDSEPVAVYYDPQLDNGTLYVWPSPSGTYTLKFSAKQYIEDFDNQNNTPYFPSEWLDAIVYNLAQRLCPKYEVSSTSSEYLEIKIWLKNSYKMPKMRTWKKDHYSYLRRGIINV